MYVLQSHKFASLKGLCTHTESTLSSYACGISVDCNKTGTEKNICLVYFIAIS